MSGAPYSYIREPREIYRESFATVRREARLDRLPEGLQPIAIRLVHAVGMPDLVDELVFTPGAAVAGREALLQGKPIFCDCEMVRSGIIQRYLPRQNELVCTLNEAVVLSHARSIQNTRSAAAVDFWNDELEGAVVAIGNAPTALFRLLERVAEGGPKPALVLGFPVGFIGAAESKDALAENPYGLEHVALRGRRGGSALASAAVNALAGGLEA